MNASAVADVERGVIHARIEIHAPPDAVFRALTDPRELAAWWGSADTYQTSDWRVDLRPGGRWSAAARRRNEERLTTVRGEYRVVDPPRVLEYTWEPSWEDFQQTLVRIELEATGAGTRMTVTHSGFGARAEGCRMHGEGWKLVLEWLAGHVSVAEAAS